MRTIDLTIQEVAFGGKGVGRHDGKAVFIPLTIDTETVSAEIVRDKKQFAEGELVDVRSSSPHRVAPPCPYFGHCGGCAYQHIDYPHQLEIKWRQVRDLLGRIGKMTDPPMRPIIPSPQAYGYRNRITVHVMSGVIGFFRRESNRLIDIEQCPISTDEVNRELRQLRESSPADGHYGLRGDAPRVFAQTNDAVTDALRELIVSLVPDKQELVIDAYCGAGFFAKALLDKSERVVGIDWDRFAIEEARKNATHKEVYVVGDVEERMMQIGTTAEIYKPGLESRRSTVIVDPPNTGLTKTIRRSIVDLSPQTLIYISCNPATLARDLNDLGRTFQVASITPLDMFPQTAEIEVVAHLHA